jgi:RNase P subunit RPR2
LEPVNNFDADEERGESVPLLSWTCFPCGETHTVNVPGVTRGNQHVVVTCPETGEKRRLLAVPVYLLSR